VNDPLGAAALRAAALTAWRAAPARLREDANAEEDHSRGGYRDRVVVELAQNAADAAGHDGRLLLRLTTGPVPLLIAANTGTALDAAGLASLATLRASAKRSGTSGGTPVGAAGRSGSGTASVGRFGVGFAAVRSVADEIAVLTADGSAHFSLAATTEILLGEPALTEVVAARRGALPALRLPFAGPGPLGSAAGADVAGPEAHWATVVVLALRDEESVAQVAAQLAAVDDGLLLALPNLASVLVEHDDDSRELTEVHRRWVVASASGVFAAADLADRPTEDQDRRGWQVTWGVRRNGKTAAGAVHAPTVTDEPCTVPALLVATFPLDPSRRHVAPSRSTDLLVERAGEVWAQLLLDCRQELAAGREAPEPLALVPRSWPAGGLDGALRESVRAATRAAPVLQAAGDGRGIAPADAEVLAPPWTCDRAALDVLGGWSSTLARLDDTQRDLVRILDIRTVEMAELVEVLPAGDPAWLRRVYDLFAGATGDVLAELAAVPVPLRDGRVVRGARGLAVVEPDLDLELLDALADAGLRIVDPAAAHPVLERLGAEKLDAAALARHPGLRDRVLGERPDEDDEGDTVAAQALLGLIEHASRAGRSVDRPEPWWGEALLEADDGELVPARGLTMPGSPAADWFDPEVLPRVSAWTVERWGEVLTTIGVRAGLTAVTVNDQVASEAIDSWTDYLDEVSLPDAVEEGEGDRVAMADLDAVLPEAWPLVLGELATGAWAEALRPVRRPDGSRAPAYTGWWLRRRGHLGLDRPFVVTDAPRRGAMSLLGTMPPVLAGIATGPGADLLLSAIGCVTEASDLDASGWVSVLDALEPGRVVDLAVAVDVWRSLAALSGGGEEEALDAVSRLPALVAVGADPEVRVVDAAEVAVVDPMWAQLSSCLPAIIVASRDVDAVAGAIDLDVGSDRSRGEITSQGHAVPLPAVLFDLLPLAPLTWVEHDDLRVDGEPVAWWVADGAVHAATAEGLADGVAMLAGSRHRDRILRLLTDPSGRAVVLLSSAGDSRDDGA